MSIPPHPYREGYRLTPQLKAISISEIFSGSLEDRAELIDVKAKIPSDQVWYVEQDCSEEIQIAILDFLRQHVPESLTDMTSLRDLAPRIPEDFVIHQLSDKGDKMTLGAVMLPSGWNPVEKIGRSFREIHSPIPGMNLDQSESIIKAIVSSGPFERYVWGLRFSPEWNDHPDRPQSKFDTNHPKVLIKLERQVTVPFPNQNALLFLIRPSFLLDREIDKTTLAQTLRSMTPEQLRYKGVLEVIEPLLDYLESRSATETD